jgi:hypothetical protein
MTKQFEACTAASMVAQTAGRSRGDIRTTKRYSHAMEEAKREAFKSWPKRARSVKSVSKIKDKGKRQAGKPAVS